MPARSAVVALVAVSVTLLVALPASADDAPPRRPLRAAPTMLLPVDLVLRSRAADRPERELVLFVGGFGSHASDETFDELIGTFWGDPRFEIRRFGGLEEHPYDTSATIETNGRGLAREIRALNPRHAPAYTKVHIVAHSMGGAVTDRAFERGVSRRDGLTTYIGLAPAHNSPYLANVLRFSRAAAGSGAGDLDALLVRFKPEAASDAARDLGSGYRAGAAPRAVERLDIRMATDFIVLASDASAPGVELRTLVPDSLGDAAFGHGAVLEDARVLRDVSATIRDGRVTADGRDAGARRAAALTSGLTDVATVVLATIGGALLGSAHRPPSPLR